MNLSGVEGSLPVVVVVVLRGTDVLALRRAPHKDAGAGLWETVSGRIEPGEESLDAARREAREETGLELEFEPRPVDHYTALRGERAMHVVVYWARWRAGAVRRSEEHDAHRWCSPAELGAMGSPTRLVEAVERAVIAAGGGLEAT